MGKKISMLRKAVAGILSAAVFTGSVFTGTVVAAGIEETVPSSRQIVTNGLAETNEDNVTVSKTVRETGTENEFEITLQVTTREKLEEIPTSSDAAVVLVMDTSGSMGKGTRLADAKKAAADFVDRFVKDSTANDKRYVSLVQFASDATTISGWKNLAGVSTSDFKTAINNLFVEWSDYYGTWTGGTNMEGGLQLAYNLINSEKGENGLLKDVKNVNIILMSDGCPTFHVKEDTRSSLTKIEGVQGGGDVAYYVDWKPVETLASTITSANINLYSVAFQTGKADFQNWGFVETEAEHWRGFHKYDCTEEGEDHWQMVNGVRKHGYWTSYWMEMNVSNWMNSFSTKGFAASNANDLTIKFDNIAKLIRLGAQAWNVTDPMGQFIEYTGAASDTAADHNRFTYADGILRWNLKSSTPEVSEAGDITTYTYTLTYPITLNTAAEGFEAGKAYATNGTTTLSYYLFSQVEDDTVIPENPDTVDFTVPTVKGYLGDLNFQKVDQYGNALTGASFTIDGTDFTGVSNENGAVSIQGLPSGFEYTLIEDQMDGYEALQPIAIRVSYGQVTKLDGTPLEKVTNIKKENPKYIVVKHEYYDAEGTARYAVITDDHIDYDDDFVPQRNYNYGNMTFEAWGDATGTWENNATDEDMDTHDDYVITLKYKQKAEVKDYTVVIHKYFDADGSLVAEVKDTDFDHMLDKEGFEPVPETTYDGEEYEVRGRYDEWHMNIVDEAVDETHNDHVYTIEYQVKKGAEEVKDYVVIIHKYFDADGSLVAEVKDTDFDHMLDKEGFEPVPETTYDGEEYEVRGRYDEWHMNIVDEAVDETHNDHVYTIEYQVKKGAEEVKDYVVIIHKYFDVDGNLVAEVRDTDFDHMLDKEGFEPMPETTYDGVEYVVRGIDEGWVNHTTDNAVGEVHNEHWYTIEYQVEDDGPRYSKIRVNHEYYTDGNHDGTEIEEFDYSEDFAPTQKPEYSEKTYTYVSTTGPKDIGDGYLEYTLVYRRTTETPPTPVVNDTVIVIEKSWENAEPYDGRITFTATNEKTGRSYTGTLRAGRNRAVITVPAGGTYIISEDVPEGYTPSFPEGDTVYVRTGSSATIYVVNSGEEEEEIDDDDTPLAPGPVDPVKPGDSDEVIGDETTPLVDPPKTGAAVRGLSVLFGAAAAALVGAVVLRKKKEK